MIEPGTRLFFQRPEEFTARKLHPGVVLCVGQTACCAALEAPLELEEGQDLLIYYELNREFVQQPARITIAPHGETTAEGEVAAPALDPEPDPARLWVDFETTGFVMAAESRACYRVTTIDANLTAKVGDEEACVLIDVSASGFSVIAHVVHARGDILPATLRYEDKQFTGDVCVQSIKALVTGDTRYGLTGLETGRGSIGEGQGRITMEIQRVQLRRQTGG